MNIQSIVAINGPLEAAKKRKYSPIPKATYRKIHLIFEDFPKNFELNNKQYKDKIIVEAAACPIDIGLIAEKANLDDVLK